MRPTSPIRKPRRRRAREWAERFADKPLVIDTAARIPQELLDAWMREDMRFRNTWLRQRHDLKDQSQSGYDLALACFGMDAGLSEQQIVDLIVHNRSLFARSHRTRLDYFQRTIAKAGQKIGGTGTQLLLTPVPPPAVSPALPAAPAPTAPPTTGPAAPQGAPVGAGGGDGDRHGHRPVKTPTVRPRRSCASGFPACSASKSVRLVKIEGKEPQYRMELAGADAAQVDQTGDWRKIEFPNVGKLISQDAVRVSIAATAGKIIPKIKAKLWETIAQAMLDACIIEQGTEEMEWEGAARMYLQHYLSETGFIPCIEGQRLQDQRKPMVIEGKIAVCTSDFQIYVNKTTYQNLPVKAIAGMLSALGAKSIRVRGPKFKDQSRWVLPLSEFEPGEYQPHDGGNHAD